MSVPEFSFDFGREIYRKYNLKLTEILNFFKYQALLLQ